MKKVFDGAPLISVIVPLFNVPEKYFADCVAHLRAQTVSNIEIVVVDDGSTNGVERLADEFAAEDDRIRVFHKENGGVSSARNFGIAEARGKYISFLDADDWIDEDILQKALELAEKDELDIVCWGVVREYGDRAVKHEFSSYLRLNELYEADACAQLREAVLDCNAELGAPFGKLIRRGLVEEDRIFFDEGLLNYAEDVEWNFRLFASVHRAVILNEYAHHYVYNPASLTSFITAQNAECAVLCFEKIRKEIKDAANEAKLQEQIDYRFLFMLTAISVCGFFHPKNHVSYSEKKRAFKAYVAKEEVKRTLRSPSRKRLSFAQRTVIFCMRHRWCFALRILASVRYREKKAA